MLESFASLIRTLEYQLSSVLLHAASCFIRQNRRGRNYRFPFGTARAEGRHEPEWWGRRPHTF
jgi:hypothetical protein